MHNSLCYSELGASVYLLLIHYLLFPSEDAGNGGAVFALLFPNQIQLDFDLHWRRRVDRRR